MNRIASRVGWLTLLVSLGLGCGGSSSSPDAASAADGSKGGTGGGGGATGTGGSGAVVDGGTSQTDGASNGGGGAGGGGGTGGGGLPGLLDAGLGGLLDAGLGGLLDAGLPGLPGLADAGVNACPADPGTVACENGSFCALPGTGGQVVGGCLCSLKRWICSGPGLPSLDAGSGSSDAGLVVTACPDNAANFVSCTSPGALCARGAGGCYCSNVPGGGAVWQCL